MTYYKDLIADLRSRINPAYAGQIGTESHERKMCADVIESLCQQLAASEEAKFRAIGVAADLTEKLAECERGRDALLSEMRANPNDYPNLLRINREHAEYCDSQLAALQTKHDELVADAKRYRYIRAEIGFRNGWLAVSNFDTTQWENFRTGDDLDSAIDAALAKVGADKTGEGS